jgi:hypothetical protein
MAGKEKPTMEIPLGIAYEKLKTRFIRITPMDPKGKSVTTHDHEIDDEGNLVSYLPNDETNLFFMCSTNDQAEVHDDHLLVRNRDGILFKIQFLETRPIKRLLQRVLL